MEFFMLTLRIYCANIKVQGGEQIMKLNEFVNQKRKELDISIDELVKKSGIPKGTLSKITAGINSNPTLSTVEALCKALNCSLNDIAGNVQVDSFSLSEKIL